MDKNTNTFCFDENSIIFKSYSTEIWSAKSDHEVQQLIQQISICDQADISFCIYISKTILRQLQLQFSWKNNLGKKYYSISM